MLTTTRSIKPEQKEPVLREYPLAHSLLSDKLIDFCDGCLIENRRVLCTCSTCRRMRYCNKNCQRSVRALHKLECAAIQRIDRLPTAHIRLLLRMALQTKTENKPFMNTLVSHAKRFEKDDEFMKQFQLAHRTLLQFLDQKLPVSPEELFILFCQLKINCFTVTDPNGIDVAIALYPNGAKLDHSCRPDWEYIFKGKEIIFMEVDEQQFHYQLFSQPPSQRRINYVDPVASTAQRREELKERYFFFCECPLCLDIRRDRRIVAPVCCRNLPLERGAPLTPEMIGDRRRLHPDTTVVRRCRKCHLLYDEPPIAQIAMHAANFRNKRLSLDGIEDAVVLYHRLRGIKNPVAKVPLKTIQDHPSWDNNYFLYGHRNSVVLAQICRAASAAMLDENIRGVLHHFCSYDSIANAEMAHVENSLIAAGIDLYEWHLTWITWPSLASGYHCANMLAFMLRWLSDEDFHSTDRMERIRGMCASYISDSTLIRLAWTLCKAVRRLLGPFAPFDDTITKALRRLDSISFS